MSGHNILILDDQEENLSSTKDLLHRWGYKVDAVTTGTEAVENVKSGAKNYAVALLDYCLADKTGTEVGKEIRAIDRNLAFSHAFLKLKRRRSALTSLPPGPSKLLCR